MLRHYSSSRCSLALVVVAILACSTALAAEPDAATVELFHKQILPVLSETCFRCHGGQHLRGGLRVDSREALLKGGKTGAAIVSGNPQKSLLIRAIRRTSDDLQMPPSKPLHKATLDAFDKWVRAGAPWPKTKGNPFQSTVHWSFAPIQKTVPPPDPTSWSHNAIDRFVAATIREKNIKPSPDADKVTLIRRLSLDLLGLPPTLEDADRFLSDKRPDAYERLVDRYLASPHYGERWGRHWLDLARYADSGGYESDQPRTVWRYRNWVINALNHDLPFDQFVVEQLAGDLLPGATTEQKIATGFHCNAMLDRGVRWESIIDRVNTTGTVFLGLTVGCAQCHDHKTDPISHREFYQFYKFFDEGDVGNLELAPAETLAARDVIQSQVDARKKELVEYEKSLAETLPQWETQLSDQNRKKLSTEAQNVLKKPADKRTKKELEILVKARGTQDARHQELTQAIAAEEKKLPQIPTTLVMNHSPKTTHIFVRGDVEQLGDIVQADVPEFLHEAPPGDKKTRLHLAQWLTSLDNPLTARVTVNRMWQKYFGLGLVESENDFGTQIDAPLHLPLLDWLAAEFIDRSWSQKAMHRLIVNSATYRQSSHVRLDLQQRDPQNRLLARQQRLRLEAECIRDVALHASGLLSRRIGGPSVFPYQPGGVLDFRATPATWTMSTGADRYRRGMYTWIWRLTPHPMHTLFDAPDNVSTCTRRDRSNTPVQALSLMNDPSFLENARTMATRVLNSPGDTDQQLRYAFRLCLTRQPTTKELQLLRSLLQDELKALAASTQDIANINASPDTGEPARQRAAWTVLSRALLNLDESITRE